MNLEESIKMTVNSCGLELYDILTTKENNIDIFRVLISSPNGVTLNQCSKISKLLSPILDVDEPMYGRYALEVSSPGIERRLRKTQHYEASIGESISIKDLNKNIIKGILKSANEKEIIISIEDVEQTISYKDISSARTYFNW